MQTRFVGLKLIFCLNSQTEEMSDDEIDQPDIFLLSVSYKQVLMSNNMQQREKFLCVTDAD